MRRRQPLKSNKLKKWLAAPYAVWAAGFIIIPLILILYYAFTGEEGGFTLSNFAYVATKENIKALGLALWLSLLSTALCLLLAYPLAMILANRNVNQTSFIVLIFILPMWMNFMLRILAWRLLLSNNGIVNALFGLFGFGPVKMLNTPTAVVFGMVYDFLPFMILQIQTSLSKMDNSLLEASADLGASPAQTFKRVTLPLSVPGIINGITLVFLPAVSSFFIPKLLGGGQYFLIGNMIENQFITVGEWNFGSAISMIMAVIMMVLMMVVRKIEIRNQGGKGV